MAVCHLAGHRRLTDAVHDEGAKIIMQTAMVDGLVDELATDEVEGVVRQFGEAAAHAERAGYDGVQIHAAHFFYLSKFISPLFNHRTDRFGGSAEGRARILASPTWQVVTETRTSPFRFFRVEILPEN